MWCVGLNPDFEGRQTCVRVQTLPLTDQLSWDKSLSLSEPLCLRGRVMKYSLVGGHLPCVQFRAYKDARIFSLPRAQGPELWAGAALLSRGWRAGCRHRCPRKARPVQSSRVPTGTRGTNPAREVLWASASVPRWFRCNHHSFDASSCNLEGPSRVLSGPGAETVMLSRESFCL